MSNGSSEFVADADAPVLTAEQASHLHCYVCGNDNAYELHEVEESVTVGGNTALVQVTAALCRFCGERVYDLPTRARIEAVRERLDSGDVAGFEAVGVTYRVR